MLLCFYLESCLLNEKEKGFSLDHRIKTGQQLDKTGKLQTQNLIVSRGSIDENSDQCDTEEERQKLLKKDFTDLLAGGLDIIAFGDSGVSSDRGVQFSADSCITKTWHHFSGLITSRIPQSFLSSRSEFHFQVLISLQHFSLSSIVSQFKQ
ncbi:hypothetical protein L3X38_010968 [Prunus dulcis]|uniref:Uncharacterized protein n=1 Tax=Prunus dulcis TaxID=3755 RepID=A0AAD4WIR6_PRUDU|nr:hypothetical protein L3X38_010968 [Prunus dulcis]